MTILPKKKQNSNRETTDESVDSERTVASYDSFPNFGHVSHVGHSRGHSPQTSSRWNAISNRNEDKRSANDSDNQLDSGPTHSKRRHRRDDNLRLMRKSKALPNVVNAEVVVEVNDKTEGAKCGDKTAVEVVGNQSIVTETASGYNSGDEYEKPSEMWTKEEWDEKERQFAKRLKKKGFTIKQMGEDGACLFRAVGK